MRARITTRVTPTFMRAVLVSLLLSLNVAHVASAQQASGASSDDGSSAYGQAIAEAVRAYELGDYQAALRAFTAAHALSPNARTHRGLGIVLFALGDFPQAIDHLDAALASATVPLDDQLREQTRLLRDAAAQQQAAATQVATAENAPANVEADGEDASPSAGGDTLVEPAPASEGAPHAAAEGSDNPSEAPLAHAPPRRQRPRLLWALAGAAYGATALAVVPWAIGRARLNSLSAWCAAQPAGGCTPDQRSSEWDARGIDTLRRAARGLAIAGAASALVLSIVAWRRSRDRQVRLGVSLLEPGAALRLRF